MLSRGALQKSTNTNLLWLLGESERSWAKKASRNIGNTSLLQLLCFRLFWEDRLFGNRV